MVEKVNLAEICQQKGLRMTNQRRIIAQIISDASDHPDVEKIHQRAIDIDPKTSIATVYRTVSLMEELGLVDRHEFGDGRSRFEMVPESHHDHVIDVETGAIVEFVDPEVEILQQQIAARLGYRLVDHRMELYAVKIDRDK